MKIKMLEEKVVSNITRGCYNSFDEITFDELLGIVKQCGNEKDYALLALVANAEEKMKLAEIIM